MADEHGGAVIIKKVKKIDGGAHHGGSWKIAYADFVTAMMAFFLLLWLLNSVTQEQLEGISNYFAPASTSATTSGAGGVLGGRVLGEEGSEQSARAKPTVSLALPPPKTGLGGEQVSEVPTEAQQQPREEPEEPPEQTEQEASEEAIRRREEQQFEQAKQQLEAAMQEIPNAQQLAKSLLVDDTPEGLRIQLVDQEGLAMFPSGAAEPLPRTVQMLTVVKEVVEKMPQKIAISGHTDAVQFSAGSEYTNWELSVDRANSARRVLRDLGLPVQRLSRVVGKADTEPLVIDDPRNPRNRRLSIVLLRGTGDPAAAGGAVNTAPPGATSVPLPPGIELQQQ